MFSVAGALGIAGLGRRARHDVATALTFVMMLGVGALFVSWSTEYAQEAYSLLFGEVFGVSQAEVLPIVVLGAAVHRRDHRHVPAADAVLGDAGGSRGARGVSRAGWSSRSCS